MGASRRRALFVAVVVLTLALPAAALAAFPGTNTNESVRLNTPNDPDYDPAEPDGAPQASTNVFDDEYARFGFTVIGRTTRTAPRSTACSSSSSAS